MANERTYPCLPCGDLDESIAFYEALGFRRTYRQVRPNPYAVVALEDIQIHLFAARLGDAHGDEALALRTLESGIARLGEVARPAELARAYLYRAELALRTRAPELARASLVAAESLELTSDERANLAEEFAQVAELIDQD